MSTQSEGLGDAAREARERLDERLRAQRTSEIRRHNSTGSLRSGSRSSGNNNNQGMVSSAALAKLQKENCLGQAEPSQQDSRYGQIRGMYWISVFNVSPGFSVIVGVMLAKMMASMVLATLFFPLFGSAVLEVAEGGGGFTFNGFSNARLSLDGSAMVSQGGLLSLSNTTRLQKGHAFVDSPLQFCRPLTGGKPFSFSTTFVFAIVPEFPGVGSHGMAFVVSASKNLRVDSPGQYLGLFSPTNDGNASNHILAVEFDVLKNPQFYDIDDNHVGIDVNSIRSANSELESSRGEKRSRVFENLTVASGDPVQAWIEFDSRTMQLNVTVSPFRTPKPEFPLLSATLNHSQVFLDSMYVGFTSATGRQPTTYYVLGWSFQINGTAQALTNLPALPPRGSGNKKRSSLVIWLPIAGSMFLLVTAVAIVVAFVVVRKIKFAELLEDWEVEYGPHRFSYKDLFIATKGFVDKELLGYGGFGKVYRGVLPNSNMQVAVKRVSHDSRQGMREFIAEIVSIGRLRHRNLVQLLGYCRRKGEFLLVYDLMPNGSLDKLLFCQTAGANTLDWNQRLNIIKGVASGLLYLHEGWEQVVIHRDIKASNVLLDSEFNGRLGDFGLARLYDHGGVLQTTHVVGTVGYLAPELTRTGKATKATDVFAFGAFLLEVACGRKPIERQGLGENFVLVDWVLEKWRAGDLVEAADPRLKDREYAVEVILVLTLALHCSNPVPTARPSMRQVMQILEGDAPLPQLPVNYMNASFPEQRRSPESTHVQMSNPSYTASGSLLYVGR
ncbi:hypothetical protein Taro_002747 [Colocasia esculenta]|uniref:non-specific serine/threonine protein kinase n=1 Tax=Colocasia esculenta TaxID=4460 RepID=A0A843TDN7_COLES|nr:hypothetical protein [Colocasia esculenta]